jgi:hypothetical protein
MRKKIGNQNRGNYGNNSGEITEKIKQLLQYLYPRPMIIL